MIAWARNWQISWWEWHVLMLAAFVVIAAIARREWHEERFSALYLDRTLAGARDVSVLLADLSGFTAYSERREPGQVATMLNTYFETIVPLLEANGGEVHQIVGDEVMAIFNKQGDTPDHPERAARAALLPAGRGRADRGRPPEMAALPHRRQQRRRRRGGRRRRARAPQARRRRRHRQPRCAARGGRPPGHGRDRRSHVPPAPARAPSRSGSRRSR